MVNSIVRNVCTILYEFCDQSPINIDPAQLVRDLSLDEAPKFTVDKRPTSGNLYNTGQALVFRVDPRGTQMPVNITGGPLSYRCVFISFSSKNLSSVLS